MRPANGSATVFQMNTRVGPLSSAVAVTASPLDFSTAGSGRSTGEGV